jgi:hypothetical protein
MSSVKQVEQLVRISREFGRDVATGKERADLQDRHVLRQHRRDAGANGFAPNRRRRGARLQRAA